MHVLAAPDSNLVNSERQGKSSDDYIQALKVPDGAFTLVRVARQRSSIGVMPVHRSQRVEGRVAQFALLERRQADTIGPTPPAPSVAAS